MCPTAIRSQPRHGRRSSPGAYDEGLGGEAVDQIAGWGHVALLAWAEGEADRQAQGVYTDMQLGPEAAA
jgi:hypothetical protein